MQVPLAVQASNLVCCAVLRRAVSCCAVQVAVHADVRRAHWSASKAAEQHVEQLRRLADHNAVEACISHQKLDEVSVMW
jgi:hypothetical protein